MEKVLAYRKRALNDAADQMDLLHHASESILCAATREALQYLKVAFNEARVLAIGGLEVLRFGLQDISCQLCWASEPQRSAQIARVFRRDLEAVMTRLGHVRLGMMQIRSEPCMPSFWQGNWLGAAFGVDVAVRPGPGGISAVRQWAESMAVSFTSAAGEFQALAFILQTAKDHSSAARDTRSIAPHVREVPVPRAVEARRAALLISGCGQVSFPKVDIITVAKADCASIWRKFPYASEATSVMLPAASVRLFTHTVPSSLQLQQVQQLLEDPRQPIADVFSPAAVLPAFDANVLQSPDLPAPPAGNRSLVFVCLHTTFCGGHGDRLFGLLSAFLAAKMSNRTFYIDMRAPLPLTSVLSPRHPWPAATTSCVWSPVTSFCSRSA